MRQNDFSTKALKDKELDKKCQNCKYGLIPSSWTYKYHTSI